MKGLIKFAKKHGTKILAAIAVLGVVGTAVASSNDHAKAEEAIKEQEDARGALTTVEKVKIAWPSYIPTVLISAITIASIVGSNVLSRKQQAAMLSAYIGANQYINAYQNKVKEEIGVERERQIREETIKELQNRNEYRNVKYTVVDSFANREYEGLTLEDISYAIINVHEQMALNGWASLNSFYKYLGVPDYEYDSDDELYFPEIGNGYVIPFQVELKEDWGDPQKPRIYMDFVIRPGDDAYWESWY